MGESGSVNLIILVKLIIVLKSFMKLINSKYLLSIWIRFSIVFSINIRLVLSYNFKGNI